MTLDFWVITPAFCSGCPLKTAMLLSSPACTSPCAACVKGFALQRNDFLLQKLACSQRFVPPWFHTSNFSPISFFFCSHPHFHFVYNAFACKANHTWGKLIYGETQFLGTTFSQVYIFKSMGFLFLQEKKR